MPVPLPFPTAEQLDECQRRLKKTAQCVRLMRATSVARIVHAMWARDGLANVDDETMSSIVKEMVDVADTLPHTQRLGEVLRRPDPDCQVKLVYESVAVDTGLYDLHIDIRVDLPSEMKVGLGSARENPPPPSRKSNTRLNRCSNFIRAQVSVRNGNCLVEWQFAHQDFGELINIFYPEDANPVDDTVVYSICKRLSLDMGKGFKHLPDTLQQTIRAFNDELATSR